MERASVWIDDIVEDAEAVREKIRKLADRLPIGATLEIVQAAEHRASKIIEGLKEEADYLRFIE